MRFKRFCDCCGELFRPQTPKNRLCQECKEKRKEERCLNARKSIEKGLIRRRLTLYLKENGASL